jgi:hypothetical protein
MIHASIACVSSHRTDATRQATQLPGRPFPQLCLRLDEFRHEGRATSVASIHRLFTRAQWLGLLLGVLFGLGWFRPALAQCGSSTNPIVVENCLPGNPASEWDIGANTAGDLTIQGFATDISVNVGGTAAFKIKTDAKAYTINIYRLGYYSGMGARKVATITPSVPLPQTQPACFTDTSVGLMDCGNWAVSASWSVPTTAVSGVYIAHLTRTDTGGESHIAFVVRNDSSHSNILYQTSDETWQAYNYYGEGSFYGDQSGIFGLDSRSYKISYNRPFLTRSYNDESATWLFGAEFPMIQWLEQNGYDVSYFTSVDAARNGSLIKNHKIFMDSGHDEYWSGPRRANVQAARDAGVNLGFFSGNEMFWKTRWENSSDGTNTPYRTLVCYKETLAFAKLDPSDPPTWTGTWRDTSFSPPADGGKPENALTGTLFMVNGPGSDNDGSLQLQVPSDDGKMRFWRNTAVARLATGSTYTMPQGTLGYEWDEDIDNGSRPAGLIHLSTSSHSLTSDLLLDAGATYGAGNAVHHMTLYRAPSGALVFGSGTVSWSWGLNGNHDNPFGFNTPDPDPNMQQATVNLLADMGAQPNSIQTNLQVASASTDTTPPVSVITSPASGANLNAGTAVSVAGTATDSGGGVVGGVEVSGDGGTTWHAAVGRSSWSYSFTPTVTGQVTILSRAADDSGNIETPKNGVTVSVAPQVCPCGVWNTSNVPGTPDSGDGNSVEVGLKFRADADGSVVGVRFYKAPANTGTHVGHLWTSSGAQLAVATFTSESSSGWQQVNFAQPVAITANTTYIVSYYAPQGHYSADANAFASAGVDDPPLHALANGVDGSNGIFNYTSSAEGTFPNTSYRSTNYWVDVVYTSSNTYALGGTLSGPGGAGATVSLSGAETLSTTADSSGNYTFDGVVSGSYTVTPSHGGVTFTPASRNVSIGTGSVSGVNFSATVSNPLSISGTITNGASATVNLGGAATATTTADSGGNYSFGGLLGGGYTVSPQASGEIFSPGSQSVTLSSSNATGVNFTAQTCNCISVWPSSTTPSLVDANDGTPVEVGMKFRSDVVGQVVGVRFYKAAGNTGTHVGHLWSSTGTQLAAVTFSNETASGWQQASFSSPVAISSGTTYVISYYAPIGHYSADSGYFTSSGADNAPLHALANGTDGPDGVYLYTAAPGAFPTNTYGSANYWVDVLFAPSATYSVSGTVSGASGAGATVQLGGSASVTTTADGSGNYKFLNVPAGTYAVTPTSAIGFVPGTQTITVSQSNVTGVNFSMSPLCPCNSIWVPSAFPATVDSKEAASVELGTQFSADFDGYILGIRFYKAAANTGQHVVNLWSGTGNGVNLATANAAAESPSGWQQITFANPIPISAHTTYVASYFAPAGHYSDDVSYFSNGGVDNAPLHASQDTSAIHNGVYSYGSSSTYPTSTFNAANYWVDVLYAEASSYAAGGQVTGNFAGVTLTLSGAKAGTTGVDGSGNYSFNNLPNGTYTVTPSKAGVTYTPASQTVTISGAHALGINFVASTISYTVSGTVTGAPNDAVVLAGTNTYNTVTDASGNYTFTGVVNGSYTATPGSAGFAVTPASQSVTVNGANVSGLNFTASAQAFNISGTISGGAGATVTLSGGASATTTADGSGNYSFAGYPNGSYTVTPARTGLVFTPASSSVAVQGANITNANFTVPSVCPCDTLWQPSVAPTLADAGDTHAGEYGVKIRADQDGYIAGIRFYKSAANTGVHTGDLWSNAGTKLGAGSFASETPSGWQQVLFAQPVPVTKNTTYVVSYFTTAGHYSADSGYFTSSGVDTVPLHALANGVDGQNGVYGYGTSSLFPTSSFNAANYWVDAVYLPTTTYTIAGALTGTGAAGATVKLSGGSTATVTADSFGNFSFNGLANGTYTVTPSASGASFSPASQPVTINNGHALGLAFAGTVGTFTLSGTISGAGGSGATVNLTGASTASVTANTSGVYGFTGLANGSYTVTPTKSGFVMTPTSLAVTISGANATANFSSGAPTFTLSGTISGTGGAGATVSLTGASTASVTANTSGVYTFTGLPNGSYTVTPTKVGFVMTPTSQAVTINGANATANFTSAQTFTLSGTISGAGGSGATVNLTGAKTASVTANTSGVYSFTGLANGSYTVTPTKSGFVMTPVSQAVTINGANATANFTSAQTFTLGGTISGTGGSGATVNLTGAKTASVTANTSGVYSFTGLTIGSYTVTPTKSGFLMTPVSQAVTINGANATANFSSAPTFTLSGTISGSGGSGATVKLTGTTTATVTANTSGQFTFTGLPNGTYTVTPSKGLHVYNPTKQTVTVSGANKTGVNFSTLL